MDQYDMQRVLLEVARRKAGNPKGWVRELSDLLHKSRYAVYKKIAGTCSLSLEECVIVAKHYQISMDAICRNDIDVSAAPSGDTELLYGIHTQQHLLRWITDTILSREPATLVFCCHGPPLLDLLGLPSGENSRCHGALDNGNNTMKEAGCNAARTLYDDLVILQDRWPTFEIVEFWEPPLPGWSEFSRRFDERTIRDTVSGNGHSRRSALEILFRRIRDNILAENARSGSIDRTVYLLPVRSVAPELTVIRDDSVSAFCQTFDGKFLKYTLDETAQAWQFLSSMKERSQCISSAGVFEKHSLVSCIARAFNVDQEVKLLDFAW